MSLADLKKRSSNSLAELQKKATAETAKGGSYKDDRVWSPYFDKEAGTGSAVIRFLAAPEGEDLPWAKVFSHGFKGPTGKWYIENSLSTIGGSDALGNLNSRLWNSGVESDKEVARAQKRKIGYYSNVLVVRDPANPENEGKVFIYRYGVKVYEMIQNAMSPKFEDEQAVNPFDLWDGANFHIRMVGLQLGQNLVPTYEKSSFAQPSPLAGSDDEIEKIWKQTHSLAEFLAPANFKTEDELRNRLSEVLGETVGSGVPVLEGQAPTPKAAPAEKPKAKAKAAPKAKAKGDIDGESPKAAVNAEADDLDDFFGSMDA